MFNKKVIFSCLLIFFLSFNIVLAQETTEVKTGDVVAETSRYELEVPIGNTTGVNGIADYINTVYTFVIGSVGLIAAIMIMFGGWNWIFAAGNEKSISSAKETITSAIVGLVLALASYLILYTINPDLVELNILSIWEIVPPEKKVDEYNIDPCTLDNSDISSFLLDIDNCSGAASSGTHGTGIGLTKAELAAAINQYNGDVSPILMGAILLNEAAGDRTGSGHMCSNSWSTFSYDTDGDGTRDTEGHACGAIQMLPGTAYAMNNIGSCGLNFTGTYSGSGLGDRTYNDDDCIEIIKNPRKSICLLGAYLNYYQGKGAGTDDALAASYNGGSGAISESSVCKGSLRYTCEAQDKCPNSPCYEETRNYVPRAATNKNKLCEFLGGTPGYAPLEQIQEEDTGAEGDETERD